MKTFKPYPEFQAIDVEWRKKWSDALRSGDYKQIKETLTDGNGGYCCLGVLQVIWEKPLEDPDYPGQKCHLPINTGDAVRVGDKSIQAIPVAMVNIINEQPKPVYAYGLNDEYDLTFEQIAALIDGKEVVV